MPTPAESLFVYDTGERFGGFDDPAFPSAQAVVPAGVTDPLLLDRCVTDVALTGNPRFAASAPRPNLPAIRRASPCRT